MSDYGVKPTGFIIKPLSVIKKEIEDDLLSHNSAYNVLATSVFGQIIGVFSDPMRQQWEVQQAVYRSAYPDSASDEALDQVASLSAAERPEARKSTVTLDRLSVEDGVTLPVGSAVSVGLNGERFATIEAITNSSGETQTMSALAESENYGPIQAYAEEINEIRTPVSGWSAAAAVSGTETGPFNLNGLNLSIVVDESGFSYGVTFTDSNPVSTAQAYAAINAVLGGAGAASDSGLGKLRITSATEGGDSSIRIFSGTALTALGLEVGLYKGFNSEDADPGRYTALDPEFRIYRLETLRSGGSATIEALYAGLREVDDAKEVLILENRNSAVSIEGVQPKSYECVMRGGTDQDIADLIWAKGPAGIKPCGSVSTNVTDSAGNTQIMRHTRPTDVPIYLTYVLDTDSDFPAAGNDLVKAAVVLYADTLNTGYDAIALQFRAIALTITGVKDVTSFFIGTAPAPAGTVNIPMAIRERVKVETTYIGVS